MESAEVTKLNFWK